MTVCLDAYAAQVQELRSAVQRFRSQAEGRAPIVVFSPAYGEAGSNGLMEYYLATAFDRVYLQPGGNVSLMGECVRQPISFGRRLN